MVNNFSVIFGQLPGFTQHQAMEMKCLAQGHNTAPRVRIAQSQIRTPILSRLPLALRPNDHLATVREGSVIQDTIWL